MQLQILLIGILALPFFVYSQQGSQEKQSSESGEQSQEAITDYSWQKILTYRINLEETQTEQDKGVKAFLPLIEDLIEAARAGEIEVYDASMDAILTPGEVKEIGHAIDTVFVENSKTGKKEKKIVERTLNIKNIRTIKVKEKWLYDPDNNQWKRTPIAFAPMRSVYDTKGNLVADIPLFWVYFDEVN